MFGGVWYGVLSKQWLDASGQTLASIAARTGGNPTFVPYLITIVSQVLMAWVLAGILGHIGPVTWKNGLITAGFAWLGFVLPTILVNYSFQGQKPMLSVIDLGHWLGVMLVQGAVIGAIGV